MAIFQHVRQMAFNEAILADMEGEELSQGEQIGLSHRSWMREIPGCFFLPTGPIE